MNRLREIELVIIKEHKNLKKSKNRARTLSGIIEKTALLNSLIKEYTDILKSIKHTIETKHWNEEVEIYETLKIRQQEGIKILENTRIREKSVPTIKAVSRLIIFCQRLQKSSKMPDTTPPFDIKTATAIVQTYDGSHDGLNAFVDSANLLKEFTKPDNYPLAIKFLRTRLTGKARLGLPNELATIDALVENVKSRCAETITPENVLSKLKATQQKGDANKFCNDVDSLCNQLCATYIESGVPNNVAKRMATKAGVEALTAGVTNSETKIILKAGNFDDVKQAIQKVVENSTSSSNATQILAFRNTERPERRQYNSYPNRGRFQQSQYRGNRNPNFMNNSSQYRDNQNFRNNFERGNRYPQPNGYNRNNTRGRGGQNNSRRLYTAGAEELNNVQAPQMRAPPAQNLQPQAPQMHSQPANHDNFLENAYAPWDVNHGRFLR